MQNGHVLGEDGDMVELWNSGLASYTAQNWQGAVDMMEEALRLYHSYKNETLLCIKQCYRESKQFLVLIEAKYLLCFLFSKFGEFVQENGKK